MRVCNNKFAGITGFVFWDKVNCFNFSHVVKKETTYMFLYQSICVIINIEAKAKYARNFRKLSRENVFSTTCL